MTALTGSANQPSSRFRVRQHLPRLAAQGVDVTDVQPRIDRHADLLPPRLNRVRALRWPTKALTHVVKAASRGPDAARTYQGDVTWLQRELVPGVPSWEPLLRRPMVLDVDDAIWLSPPAGKAMARTLARAADVVVAGNRYLAEWFGPHARRLEILPTAVDTERYTPRPRADEGRFVIGWIGTSSNLGFVREIAPALQAVLQARPEAELHVVSNAPPDLPGVPPERVRFVRWSPDVEVSALQAFDVGLMPLADEPWTRGKCAFKMLQYMACGQPVVVAPVGMNADVLDKAELGFAARTRSDWSEALIALAEDRDRAAAMGAAGRRVVEAEYSSAVVGDALTRLFRDVAG